MSEEIKQKDKLKDGFEDLVINDTGKNFDDDMFIIQDWWLKQFDSLLSQALQKRDEEIRDKCLQYKSYYNPIGDERNTGRHLAMDDLLKTLTTK